MPGFKQSFVQALTIASATAKESLGTIRDEGEKGYKYVEYDNTAGAVPGTLNRICYYVNGSGYRVSKVTCDLSNSTEVPAGQLMATLNSSVPATAPAKFGWVQIWGLSNILAVNVTAGVQGDPMTPTGATDGTVDVSALVTDAIAGYLEEAAPGSQTLMLDCIR